MLFVGVHQLKSITS